MSNNYMNHQPHIPKLNLDIYNLKNLRIYLVQQELVKMSWCSWYNLHRNILSQNTKLPLLSVKTLNITGDLLQTPHLSHLLHKTHIISQPQP